MAIRNVMLFAWGGGYAELAQSAFYPGDGTSDQEVSIFFFGRREAFLAQSQVKDGSQAFWTAAATIIPMWFGERSASATYVPVGGDFPFQDYFPGDYISVTPEADAPDDPVRVRQIAGKRNATTGKMDWTPTLETAYEGEGIRSSRNIKRLGVGFLGGKSSSATMSSPDILSSGTRTATTGPTMNTGDTLEVGRESSPWTPNERVKWAGYEMTATGTGGGTTSFAVIVNGSIVATCSLAAGSVLTNVCVIGSGIYFSPNDSRVSLRITADGGHPGASCKLLVVPVNS